MALHPIMFGWPFRPVLLLRFILIVNVRPLSDCLFISWLSALAVLILYRLNCMCSFPIWCLGQDVELNCIGSWALPFHLAYLLGPSQNVMSVLAMFVFDAPPASPNRHYSCTMYMGRTCIESPTAILHFQRCQNWKPVNLSQCIQELKV